MLFDKTKIGPQGTQGPQGPQGIQGNQGEKGQRGDVGPTGPAGRNGENGQKGSKGDKGDKGDLGPRGEKGEQGDRGPEGKQGPTGPQGPRGEVGMPGNNGAQGDAGPQGPQGEKGEQGSMLRYESPDETSTNDTRVTALKTVGVFIPQKRALKIVFNSKIVSKDENNAAYLGLEINGQTILEPIEVVPGVVKVQINTRRFGYVVGKIEVNGFSKTFYMDEVTDIRSISITGRVDYGLTTLFVADLIVYSDPV